MKPKPLPGILAWLALGSLGHRAVAAQAHAQNAIEPSRSRQQAGKMVVRITTKEPLTSVPPNFTVANPARIAFDFPNTANALGRTSQDIGAGRAAQHERRAGRATARGWCSTCAAPSAHEATLEGNTLVITLAEAAGGAGHAPAAGVAHFAEGTRRRQARGARHRLPPRPRRRRPRGGRSVRHHHRHRHPPAGPEHRRRLPEDRAAREPAPPPRRGRLRHAGAAPSAPSSRARTCAW